MGEYPLWSHRKGDRITSIQGTKKVWEREVQTRTLHRNPLFPLLQKECASQEEVDVEVMDIEPDDSQCMKDPLQEAGLKDRH